MNLFILLFQIITCALRIPFFTHKIPSNNNAVYFQLILTVFCLVSVILGSLGIRKARKFSKFIVRFTQIQLFILLAILGLAYEVVFSSFQRSTHYCTFLEICGPFSCSSNESISEIEVFLYSLSTIFLMTGLVFPIQTFLFHYNVHPSAHAKPSICVTSSAINTWNTEEHNFHPRQLKRQDSWAFGRKNRAFQTSIVPDSNEDDAFFMRRQPSMSESYFQKGSMNLPQESYSPVRLDKPERSIKRSNTTKLPQIPEESRSNTLNNYTPSFFRQNTRRTFNF